jgi:peptidoglycan/LPS O-acetylase OafA/YrhL
MFGGYGFALCALVVLIETLLVSEITYRFIEVSGIALGKHIIDNMKRADLGC